MITRRSIRSKDIVRLEVRVSKVNVGDRVNLTLQDVYDSGTQVKSMGTYIVEDVRKLNKTEFPEDFKKGSRSRIYLAVLRN